MTRKKRKRTCGDYGGVSRNGKPCTRLAGWGTRKKTGKCKVHSEVAEAMEKALKKRLLKQMEEGTCSIISACQKIERAPVTIWKWRQADQKFDEACEEAKRFSRKVRLQLVVDRLFSRAAIDGDMRAIEFFLCNEDPENWAIMRKMQLTGSGDGPIQHKLDLSNLSDEEIDALRQAARKAVQVP